MYNLVTVVVWTKSFTKRFLDLKKYVSKELAKEIRVKAEPL